MLGSSSKPGLQELHPTAPGVPLRVKQKPFLDGSRIQPLASSPAAEICSKAHYSGVQGGLFQGWTMRTCLCRGEHPHPRLIDRHAGLGAKELGPTLLFLPVHLPWKDFSRGFRDSLSREGKAQSGPGGCLEK